MNNQDSREQKNVFEHSDGYSTTQSREISPTKNLLCNLSSQQEHRNYQRYHGHTYTFGGLMAEQVDDAHWQGINKDRVSRKVSELECFCQLHNTSHTEIADEISPDLDDLKQKEIQ